MNAYLILMCSVKCMLSLFDLAIDVLSHPGVYTQIFFLLIYMVKYPFLNIVLLLLL